MRRILPLIAVVLFACSAGNGAANHVNVPVIDNPLTFELSFGDDESLDEYLVAKPEGIMVNAAGDIYVTDEEFVKVYDPDGRPKTIFGGEGQGPGEFTAPMNPGLAPTGYIAVMDVLWEYNVYRPDHEFIEKRKIRADRQLMALNERDNLNFTMMEQIYALDDERRVIGLFGQNMEIEGRYPVFHYLLCQKPDTLIEITRYHSRSSIKNENGGGSNSMNYVSDFLWGFIDGGRVVYTETERDRTVTDAGGEYRLITADIEGTDRDTIAVPYTPQEIPSHLKELKPYVNEEIGLHIDVNETIQEIMNGLEYFPPIVEMRTDGTYIFCFKYNVSAEERDELEDEDEQAAAAMEIDPYDTDVIDAATGTLVTRAKFPFIPDIIRDGYAYRLHEPYDAFPTVEKYRIDPAVYGIRP